MNDVMPPSPTQGPGSPGAGRGGLEPPERPEGLNFFERPPGVLFHLTLAAATLGLLWAFSVPGVDFEFAAVTCAVLGVLGLIWLVRALTFLQARSRGRKAGRTLWFSIAPILAVALVGLVSLQVPLRLRWEVNKDAFAKVVQDAPMPPVGNDWISFKVPDRIGSYEILSASRVRGGIILHERHGAFFDDAGFAYLPNGPYQELNTGWFENPDFHALGGGWYSWTASW